MKSKAQLIFDIVCFLSIAMLISFAILGGFIPPDYKDEHREKDNWKRSAIIMSGKYNDSQDELIAQKKAFNELRKVCTTEQINKAVKNTPLPMMEKDVK
jgi:hypothetical protein